MSDAAGSALIGAIFGGIKGGADANLDTIKQEAEQERKMSYAKLMQQYAQDNTMLQDKLATARQATADDRADKRTDKTDLMNQTDKRISEFNSQAQLDRQYALDVAKMEQSDKHANAQLANSASNNKGELAKIVETMRANGVPDDKIQAYLLRNTSDAVSTENIIKAKTEAFKAVNETFKDAIAAEQNPQKRKALETARDEEVEALSAKMLGQKYATSGKAEQTKNNIDALAGKQEEKPKEKGIVASEMPEKKIDPMLKWNPETMQQEPTNPEYLDNEKMKSELSKLSRDIRNEEENLKEQEVDKTRKQQDGIIAKAQNMKKQGDKRPLREIINELKEQN
jgi:hypothetical protein